MDATFSPSFSIHSKSPSPPPTTPKKGTINPPLLTPPQPPRHTCTANSYDFSQKIYRPLFPDPAPQQPLPPLITFHWSKRPLTQYFAFIKSTIYNSHCIFFVSGSFCPPWYAFLTEKHNGLFQFLNIKYNFYKYIGHWRPLTRGRSLLLVGFLRLWLVTAPIHSQYCCGGGYKILFVSESLCYCDWSPCSNTQSIILEKREDDVGGFLFPCLCLFLYPFFKCACMLVCFWACVCCAYYLCVFV